MNPNWPPCVNGFFMTVGGLCLLYLLYIYLSGWGDARHNAAVDRMARRIPQNGYAESKIDPYAVGRRDVVVGQVELFWPGHGNGPNAKNAYFVPTLDVYIHSGGDQFNTEVFGSYGRPQGMTRTHLGQGIWRWEIPLDAPKPRGVDRYDWIRQQAREWATVFGYDPYGNYLPEAGTDDDAATGLYGT